jgi:uncharacterized membrane protein
VLTSAAVVLFGAVLYLFQHGSTEHDYSRFVGEPRTVREISDIVTDVWSLDGIAVMQFGVLLLVATPVARVVLCVFAFFAQRDRLFVAVTLLVLAVLLYSLIGGSW